MWRVVAGDVACAACWQGIWHVHRAGQSSVQFCERPGHEKRSGCGGGALAGAGPGLGRFGLGGGRRVGGWWWGLFAKYRCQVCSLSHATATTQTVQLKWECPAHALRAVYQPFANNFLDSLSHEVLRRRWTRAQAALRGIEPSASPKATCSWKGHQAAG